MKIRRRHFRPIPTRIPESQLPGSAEPTRLRSGAYRFPVAAARLLNLSGNRCEFVRAVHLERTRAGKMIPSSARVIGGLRSAWAVQSKPHPQNLQIQSIPLFAIRFATKRETDQFGQMHILERGESSLLARGHSTCGARSAEAGRLRSSYA